jgi:glycosyltransferase involved in cell wall biosynthesis
LRAFLRGFDVVNVHFLSDWGFTPELMQEGCVVATAWGSDIVRPPGEGTPPPELIEARRTLLRHADAVTTCGPAFAAAVATFADISVDRIDVVPFGVDLELFTSAADGAFGARKDSRTSDSTDWTSKLACHQRAGLPVGPTDLGPTDLCGGRRVGFYKGFREVYGPTDLIRAIPIVLEALPETRFDLIGDGPQLSECQALASRLDLTDAIAWIPRQPHCAIPGWLAQWHVTVIPSVFEAFGVAALESAAMRVPVVASNVCGLADVVRDGETGLLVAPGSPGALAGAIIKLLTDSSLRLRMGRAGRERVQTHYEQNHVLDQWIGLFSRVLDRAAATV